MAMDSTSANCTNTHSHHSVLRASILSLSFSLLLGNPSILFAEKKRSSTPSPPVFQADEIQHGFAEFDSPPDFFSEDPPALYEDYSPSPSLPPSDQKPEGLFQNLVFAEDVEEDRTIRQGHIQIPINAKDTFPESAKAVYLVFSVHKHYTPYQIIGRLFHEASPPPAATQPWVDEDIADLATEDESGYLKFFPPQGRWKPGTYRVDIYVGWMVNTVNKMGAMRFVVTPTSQSSG